LRKTQVNSILHGVAFEGISSQRIARSARFIGTS
jgi:hypothetical protein